MCVRAASGCIRYRNITTGVIIPNCYKAVVSVYQMSHITKCKQTKIHRELPGLQARTVNSFHRETRENFVAIFIIALLLLALSYKLIIKLLKINVWNSISSIDSN